MNVLLTGATGVLGRPLLEQLLDDDHDVRVLAREPELVDRRATAYPWTGASPIAEHWVEGVDAVIHLAGEPLTERWEPAHRQRVMDSRVLSTRVLASAAASAGVKHFLCASAVGYYGGAREALALDETSSAGDDFPAKVCVAWEDATAAARLAGARVVLLRIGVALHPQSGALRELLPAFKVGLGGPIGTGHQYLSWVSLDDALSMTRWLLTHATASGAFNVCGPAPVTNAEFARTLGAVLNRPATVAVPTLAMQRAFGDQASVLLEGQRVFPRAAEALGFRFAHPTLEAALRAVVE
ncbi:MAG: TIGR01777 family oxidoreductase [Archangium sp.]|nr:TIGR01777 family oxidoreductase [Archangium sp.]